MAMTNVHDYNKLNKLAVVVWGKSRLRPKGECLREVASGGAEPPFPPPHLDCSFYLKIFSLGT